MYNGIKAMSFTLKINYKKYMEVLENQKQVKEKG